MWKGCALIKVDDIRRVRAPDSLGDKNNNVVTRRRGGWVGDRCSRDDQWTMRIILSKQGTSVDLYEAHIILQSTKIEGVPKTIS